MLLPLSAIGMRLMWMWMWMGEENGFYVVGGAAWSRGGNKIDSGALYRYADGGPEAAGISCAYL